MADVPICKPTSFVPRDQTPCDEGKVASGRKGLFSAACPKRRLRSRVTDTFTDGFQAASGFIAIC
jgi:hypothetical protein